MKLISMTKRVLYEMDIFNNACYDDEYLALRILKEDLEKHSKFIEQKLELYMFVTSKLVNGVWVVLEEPFNDGENDQYYLSALEEYEKAKDRVLFEGFEYQEVKLKTHYSLIRFPDKTITPLYPKLWREETIENLVKYNLDLTTTAQKQIGLCH